MILITFYEYEFGDVKDLADVKYHFEDTVIVVTLYDLYRDTIIGTRATQGYGQSQLAPGPWPHLFPCFQACLLVITGKNNDEQKMAKWIEMHDFENTVTLIRFILNERASE